MKYVIAILLLCACRGPAGNNGSNGAVGPQGPQGGVGSQGPQGIQGVSGQNGQNGTNGTNGTPGTQITIVTFCPGDTQYASEFNEVGYCIDNQLYAVYSANDGFLSLIPPGTYISDGINSSCTFTVGPNCEVSH